MKMSDQLLDSSDRLERAAKLVKEAAMLLMTATIEPNNTNGNGTNGSNLTGKESEILKLLALGLSTSEIGERLKKSKKTVEAQRDTLRKKLGVKTAVELVALAKQMHLSP